MPRLVLALAFSALATSCSNACQDLCDELADYATECEIEVPESEVDTCVDNHQRRDLEDGKLEVCQDFNDPETIREEWSCADLEEYWAEPAR